MGSFDASCQTVYNLQSKDLEYRATTEDGSLCLVSCIVAGLWHKEQAVQSSVKKLELLKKDVQVKIVHEVKNQMDLMSPEEADALCCEMAPLITEDYDLAESLTKELFSRKKGMFVELMKRTLLNMWTKMRNASILTLQHKQRTITGRKAHPPAPV